MIKELVLLISIIIILLITISAFLLPAESVDSIMPIMSLISADFIERVGFPVAVALMFLYLIIWMIKKDEKRQEKGDERYTALVNEFIDTTKTMANDNQQALGKMTLQLQDSINLISSGITKTQIRVSEMRKDIQEIMNRQREKQ